MSSEGTFSCRDSTQNVVMENFNAYIHVDREGFSQRAKNDWREDDGGDDGD